MKTPLAILAASLLAGCAPSSDPAPTWAYDQCARREMMKECLGAVPAGPVATKYNDWDEVVKACAAASAAQSVRGIISTVKPECRSQ